MSSKSKKKTVGEKCESDCCFVTDYDYNVELVSCSNCNSSYHTMCEGLSPVEEVNAGENPYTCIRCTGIVNVSDVFADQVNLLIEDESEMNKEIVAVRTQCDDLKAEYNRIIGARERSLNLALESLKVVRQAYHGSVMVGNHCVIVLEKYLELTSVINDHTELYHKLNTIFELFRKIMKLVMKKRFLEDYEISSLENLCNNFGRTFPRFFPERNIIRKIHELIFHLPPVVKKYRTVGMRSEQEGESKHAAVNAELRPLANVRNSSERICLVLEREELRSMMDKTLIQPVERLCM